MSIPKTVFLAVFCALVHVGVSADTVTMKDGTKLKNVMIADMGRKFLIVVIDKSSVESADFTTTNTQRVENALKTYEARLLKAHAPQTDMAAVRDMMKSFQSRIRGRLLVKSKPVEGVPVAIRLISNYSSIGGLVINPGAPERSGFYETTTDKNGYYEFVGVPAGQYDLLWKASDNSGWIRRLSEKPDVVLKSANEHVELRDTHIGKAPVNK